MMEHAGISFTEIALETCLELGQTLDRDGKAWHIHVFSPVCRFNPYPGAYGLVIEDNTAGITYIARSDVFPEVDKDLVKILHGDDVLDEGKGGAVAGAREVSFLDRITKLDGARANWHHHMSFPDCVFNPHAGKWTIMIESDAEPPFHETFDDEPLDLLREIEVLYFKHLDAGAGEGTA